MKKIKETDGYEEEEEDSECVLLDLDAVSGQIDIPPNAPYTLSCLDTMNPILIIDDIVKLIGEYEETMGTCFVLSEEDSSPVVLEETGPSEANLFSGKCIKDPNQAPRNQVKPVARLQKILKFRLLLDEDALVETNSPKIVQICKLANSNFAVTDQCSSLPNPLVPHTMIHLS